MAVSIPRLELCAMEIGAILIKETLQIFYLEVNEFVTFAFTDSMVALWWLKPALGMLNIYVANRVTKIKESTKKYNGITLSQR
jgi:hypothetical protein